MVGRVYLKHLSRRTAGRPLITAPQWGGQPCDGGIMKSEYCNEQSLACTSQILMCKMSFLPLTIPLGSTWHWFSKAMPRGLHLGRLVSLFGLLQNLWRGRDASHPATYWADVWGAAPAMATIRTPHLATPGAVLKIVNGGHGLHGQAAPRSVEVAPSRGSER